MVSAYRIHDMGDYGIWYGELPKGCIYCMRGSKVVIFVSGICGVDCYYCPVSYERRAPDAFYVDEERFRGFQDILDEINIVKAEGASITGGEPFQLFFMVTNIIRILKDLYGDRFHIHLYTSGYGATKEAIKKLSRIGLDEIRFHMVNTSIIKLVEFAVRETNMDVGIEIPAVPDSDWLWELVVKANDIGVKFVNLNELEVSETNIDNILIRGYRIHYDGKSIEGSFSSALKVIERAYQERLRISIHLCPAIYKDVVQHRSRLVRKSSICALANDMVSDDGVIKREGKEFIPMLDICSDYIKI